MVAKNYISELLRFVVTILFDLRASVVVHFQVST